jgi:signal peptidase II
MTSNKKFLLLSLLLIVIDQITKIAVKGFSLFGIDHHGMYLGQSIPVLGDFLRLTYVENPGMAFGIGFGSGKIFLTLFSLIASIALVWYLLRIRTSSFWLRLGLALVLAGAAGNLIDRLLYGVLYGEAPLFYGQVVDFIDFEFFDFSFFGRTFSRWPVFNIADTCVTCGMVMLLLSHKHFPVEDTSNRSAEPATTTPVAETTTSGEQERPGH